MPWRYRSDIVLGMETNLRHYTAWLSNSDGELTILADQITSYTDDQTPVWTSTGRQLFQAYTDGTTKQAYRILREAGWTKAGEWQTVESGQNLVIELA